MKKTNKRTIAFVLCFAMLVSTMALCGSVVSAEDGETTYAVGDIIEYGTYPQSQVEDSETIESLNSLIDEDRWVSYGYYSGTGEQDGNMSPKDYMRYSDVMFNGAKYRGVTFDSYRPALSWYETSSTLQPGNQFQSINGYLCNEIYWFKYEPIKWRVLDPEAGLLLCDTIIDSQPYHNYYLYDAEIQRTWGDPDKTFYAEDSYDNSSIKQWLNNDFYYTAFTYEQRENIINEEETGKAKLLSYWDARNSNYGFIDSDNYVYDSNKAYIGTSYAKCQGLYVLADESSEHFGNSVWWLMEPHSIVFNDSGFGGGTLAKTDIGVVPSINLKVLESSTDVSSSSLYITGDTIQYGTYPQSQVTDESVINELNKQSLDWISYEYYSGPGGEYYNGEMTASDFMRYADVKYNGEKYRAVVFDSYRPFNTSNSKDKDYSYQDENGYVTNNIYWFKYEPIEWRVLDPNTGLIMADSILDNQAYNNFTKHLHDQYYDGSDNPDRSFAPNNYKYSSVRNWLNSDFFRTAFSENEQSQIIDTSLDNRGVYTLLGEYNETYNFFNAQDTTDKVFLLSFDDVRNVKYGFSENYSSQDTYRILNSSDYAECQGLFRYNDSETEYIGNSYWWLRTPYNSNGVNACEVTYKGKCFSGSYTNDTRGICPAICIGEIHSEDKVIEENKTDATCNTEGSVDKVVYCKDCGIELRRENYTIPASDHHSWQYSTDKYTITASCENCDETFSLTAVLPENLKCSATAKEITITGEKPDGFVASISYDTDDGLAPKTAGTYMAHFDLRPDDLSDVILAIDIELTIEHDLTSHEGKAETCDQDGWESYETCNYCDYSTYTVIPAKNHNYVFSSYVWSDDGKSCTATATCTNDSEHFIIEEATINSAVKDEPTCTEYGTTTYTATFNNELFAEQTKDVSDIAPKQHNYVASYVWSDDGKSCTATATCTNDPEHIFSEEAAITSAVKTKPTCEEKGTTTYTASFNNKFFVAQTKDVVDIPATGHTEIIKNVVDPTCTAPGYTGTVFCSVCNQPLRNGEERPALGHEFTNYVYNNDAAYDHDGTETAKCNRCSVTDTRTKTGTKLINPTANVKINVAGAKTVDYRTKVTIKATATNLDSAYHLVLVINGHEYEGNNVEVSHDCGELKGDITYFVKVVDSQGNIQKDANGAELKKDGGKITCNAGFLQKVIAFFKGLFSALPTTTVKP